MLILPAFPVFANDIYVQIRFDVPTEPGEPNLRDALVYTQTEYDNLTKEQIDAAIEQRVINYLDVIKNPKPSEEPTVEQLQQQVAGLQEQINNAQNEIPQIQQKISEATVIEGDKESPSIPKNLVPIKIESSQIALSWEKSTDNLGVVGYIIFRDGSEIAQVSDTQYSDFKVEKGIAYQYAVKAIDKNKNESKFSVEITVTAND